MQKLLLLVVLAASSLYAQINITRIPGTIVSAKYNTAGIDSPVIYLVDNNVYTDYFTAHDTGWVQFALPSAYPCAQYTVTSGSSAMTYDPARWTLFGSNDTNAAWTVLDAQTGQSYPYRRAKYTFSISSSTAYRFYRMGIKSNGGNALDFSGIELLQTFAHDIATVRVVRPGSLVNSGNVVPQVLVRNLGTSAESFSVVCHIDSVGVNRYANSASVTSLAPGDSQVVTFPSWNIPAYGQISTGYVVSAWAALGTDMIKEDDTVRQSMTVQHLVFSAFPKPLQLYCRGAGDSAVVPVQGKITQPGVDSVSVTLYKNGTPVFHNSQTTVYSGDTAAFTFSPKIHAELSMYKVEFRANTLLLATADSIVCGDAFLVDGQSNSCDGMWLPAQPYLRTFGFWVQGTFGFLTNDTLGTLSDTAWYVAGTGVHIVNGWGMSIAKKIIDTYNIPVCLISGGDGGTVIAAHARSTSLQTIYGRYRYRIQKADIAQGIKWVIWDQGESDTLNPTYKQEYYNLVDSWKSDFPGLAHFYLFQVRPGCWGKPGLAEVREAQRQAPLGRANVSVMSTANASQFGGCHYGQAGYIDFANWMYPLIARDFYNSVDTANIKAPDIQQAWFANTARTRVVLKFDQPVLVPADAGILDAFGLGVMRTHADSVKADTAARTVTVFLTNPADSSVFSYGLDTLSGGGFYTYPWLVNKRGIGVLTFSRFPIQDSSAMAISEATEISSQGNSLLAQPNPFNPSLSVRYSLASAGKVKLALYSVKGSLVRTLTEGYQTRGRYQSIWDGRDNHGRALSSGIYILSLTSPGFKMEKRVTLLK